MAVAFHEPEFGGASRAVLNVVPLLEERGWRFVFWAPGPGPLDSELRGRGYEVAGEERSLRYSWRSLRIAPGPLRRLTAVPGYLQRFRAWLRAQSPALVHANTLITIPEAVVARSVGAPTLLYVHETLPVGWKGRAAAWLARLGADGVIGISAATVSALQRQGVSAVLVHDGVQVPERVPPPRGQREPIVVGTLGTISRRKGSDVFLSAVRHVRRELPDVEFRMIGPCPDGRDRVWAEEIVAAARRDDVQWGTRADVFEELAQWDILALPSRDEPFGLAVVEAMAMGVPVIATRVGGLREIVSPDVGVLVDPDDAGALAGEIVRLVRDPRLRGAMGTAGRSRVHREFTLERQADGVHRAYVDTLARAGVRVDPAAAGGDAKRR